MRFGSFAFIMAAVLLLAGCAAPQSQATPSPVPVEKPDTSNISTPAPTPTPSPLTLTVETIADPSLLAEDIQNPFDEINRYVTEIYSPDEMLYNALYDAVAMQAPSLDISAYDLTYEQKYQTASCLFSESDFRFYYFYNFKLSKNGNTIIFNYTNTSNAAENEETFIGRLSQLLYNTAPEDGTDIQKFIAVYQYLCEISNYSQDATDSSTFTPYSILMNGEGICSGYSVLFDCVLNSLDIPAEFVSNETHAWNMVNIDGAWYQTDLTWGAGAYADDLNNTYTLLMDDQTRQKSLAENGINSEGIHIGFSAAEERALPACLSTRFTEYQNIGCAYTFDIPNNYVYFCGEDGISRMNLDGSGNETLANGIYADQMAFFNGVLYYVNIYDCYLYKLVPGKSPELLDDSEIVFSLTLDGTSLSYISESGERRIPLLPFNIHDFSSSITNQLTNNQFPRSQTFQFLINFSAPVDTTQNWNECVYLSDADGSAIPLHFSLSEDAKILSARPSLCIADKGMVSLCIAEGIVSSNGVPLTSPYRMDVTLYSAVE